MGGPAPPLDTTEPEGAIAILRCRPAQLTQQGETDLALQLGATAPGLQADTAEGAINFQDWLGDSRALLFSHPSDRQTPPSASL